MKSTTLSDWIPHSTVSDLCFSWLHQSQLIYVTCWEDPRIDHQVLQLSQDDTVLVITSAGCNALDYALEGPLAVYAVDVNPRQNALLDLKIAGIKALDFETFFQLFGRGHLPQFSEYYHTALRPLLSADSQRYWDAHGMRFFAGDRSFYFRGTTGNFARILNYYIDQVIDCRQLFNDLLASASLTDQQRIFREEQFSKRIWRQSIRKFFNSDIALWLVGVPQSQKAQLECQFRGGIAEFIEQTLETVFGQLPLQDNYFWRVFLTGEYTPTCCPRYLQPEHFQALKAGLVNRITLHTDTVTSFLQQHSGWISRFVLLDHMDWLGHRQPDALRAEWQTIFQRATPQARAIFRSSGTSMDYLDSLSIDNLGNTYRLGDLLHYQTAIAEHLHESDRVHTYTSFYVADLCHS